MKSKNLPFTVKNCFIAGGAVLSWATKQPISDYDIYPKNKKAAIDAISSICESNAYVFHVTRKAVSIKLNDEVDSRGNRVVVQVMLLGDDEMTPEKIFERFDFTVCMCAVDLDTDEFYSHPDFWKDVASRTLRFNPKTFFPLASIGRIAKYQSKGYHLSKPEHYKMALTVAKNPPTSWESLESQLGGVYGYTVDLNKLKETAFSIDAMNDFLSSTEFDSSGLPYGFTKTTAGESIGLDPLLNALEVYFGISPVPERGLKSKHGFEFLIGTDGTITLKDTLFDVEPNLPDWLTEEMNKLQEERGVKSIDDVVVKSFKVFMKDNNGKLWPVVKNTTDMKYAEGEVSTEEKTPYLFVAKRFSDISTYVGKGASKDMHVIHEVFFKLSDVRKIGYDSWQVSKFLIGKEISKDGFTNSMQTCTVVNSSETDLQLEKLK